MKLDYDCVRNILLTVESLECGKSLCRENYASFELLKNYDEERISYTVKRLVEAGYVPKTSVTEVIAGIIYSVDELTWDGHQYLDCIRDKEIWEKTRKKAAVFDSVPFKTLSEIALYVIRSGVGLPF